jgi:ribulose-5-phosphate 4-epimerase/fuculose-1-phosphate aldolase
MERLSGIYEKKLREQCLAEEPLFAELETEIQWNRRGEETLELEKVFGMLSISSLLFARPAEPYASILESVASAAEGSITLRDNETRTFLHDIPVIGEFSAGEIAAALRRRKSVIVRGRGVATHGTVSPEQAFVSFSSVLFSCFVKYLADYLTDAARGRLSAERKERFARIASRLPEFPRIDTALSEAPFRSEEEVYRAVAEAGKPVVKYGFVDSVMGNISYLYNDVLYISQTGSFLDELEGCIDPCPMDRSACTGITASSELPAHMAIVEGSSKRAVLHGHPKFSVVMSLICEKEDCEFDGQCHVRCPEKRHIDDIPIVPGETGTGPRSLSRTVPAPARAHRGIIVYGHGVFATGEKDFNAPFAALVDIEKRCRELYFSRLRELGALP